MQITLDNVLNFSRSHEAADHSLLADLYTLAPNLEVLRTGLYG